MRNKICIGHLFLIFYLEILHLIFKDDYTKLAKDENKNQ